MKTKPLTFLLALTFLFLFSGSVFADDLKDAMAAHKSKDYKEAVRFFDFQQNKVMQRHNTTWG